MPLLYGDVASGGMGEPIRMLGSRNRWRQQMLQNPNFGRVWNPPQTEEQSSQAPKMGTPAASTAPSQAQMPDMSQFYQQLLSQPLVSSPTEGGSSYSVYKSDPISMAETGIPGATQEMSQGVFRFLPEHIRRMMGV